MTLSCLCGQIHLSVDSKPAFINACNCTLCRKAGARWAYYSPSAVRVEGPTRAYSRADKPSPNAQVHFCADCGSTTHFVLSPEAVVRFGDTLMGVNMALADERDLSGVELRYPDGRSWSGAGDFTYVREPRIIP
jgi:hypothetical protein